MASMEKRKSQKNENPEMNSEDKTSSETTLSDSTSSEQKSVTLVSSSDINNSNNKNNNNNNNSSCPSFSKLLQGVVLSANSTLSSNSSVTNSGFQGQFGMSHQEALADVTAKAAQAHPQMQVQPESTKSLKKPLQIEKVEEHEMKKANSSCHTGEPPEDVPRTPINDGYSWRKYGQKQVKSSGSSRSYYRCTNLSCSAKKKVQHLDVSGQVIEVVYKGDHNHDPPQIIKGSNRRKDLTPRVLKNSSDSIVQNLDNPHSLTRERDVREPKQLEQLTLESQDIKQKSAAGTPPRDEELCTKTIDTTSSELAIVPAVEDHSLSRSDSSNELAMIDPMKEPDVMPLKKRRIKERGKPCSESVYRTFKDPRIVVHTAGDNGISDGYRWRKYGQKMVKGTPHPRSYYRCSSPGCPVRKHVERATDNSTAVIVTYEGQHDHDIPVPKKHHHQASPNYASITASGANTLLDESENKSVIKATAEEPSQKLSDDHGEEKGSEAAGDKVLESARTLLSIGIELKSC